MMRSLGTKCMVATSVGSTSRALRAPGWAPPSTLLPLQRGGSTCWPGANPLSVLRAVSSAVLRKLVRRSNQSGTASYSLTCASDPRVRRAASGGGVREHSEAAANTQEVLKPGLCVCMERNEGCPQGKGLGTACAPHRQEVFARIHKGDT